MRKSGTAVIEAELHEYADGQLSPERAAAVAAHLGVNPAEAARVAEWKRQNEMIRQAFEPFAREPVPVQLSLGSSAASRFAAAPARQPGRAPLEPVAIEPAAMAPAPPARAGTAALIFGLSAALAVSGLGFLAMEHRDTPAAAALAPSRDFAARAFEAHRAFAGDGGEAAAGRGAALARWLAQRTGLAIAAPDLASEGIALLGGRVVPDETGPAALLLLEAAGGERFSLLAARQPAGMEPGEPRFVEGSGLNAATFSASKMRMALTGRSGREKMLRLARMVAEQAERR